MDNEYLDLPNDPEEAFAVLHRRKYAELEATWENSDYRGWDYERRFVDVMLAFDDVMGLGALDDYQNVPNHDSEFGEFWHRFRRHMERTTTKFQIEAARRQKSCVETIIVLDEAQRQAIHHLVQKIREHLESAQIPDNKRDALFNKLNAFAAELDRNRTRAEAFYAFAIDSARAAKEVNSELKPLQQTIDKVFDWIDKAKKYADALPPWSERKKIEGPQKQLPSPDEPSQHMDDDIPF